MSDNLSPLDELKFLDTIQFSELNLSFTRRLSVSETEIERLPGNVPGAMVNMRSEVEKLLARHVSQHPDVKDVKIKFSGDGAKVSRISNFVIFSLSNVSVDETSSFQKQQTFAIVECSENYESLKKCCGPIFDQFNSLADKDKWTVCETDLNVSFFVCADMKFIQLMLGLGSSTGEYACPWCKVNKKGRSDLSFEWDFYHKSEMCRNIIEMNKLVNCKPTLGCKHVPLLSLPIDHFVPDELHLMLRVTDVLLRNLIEDANEMDADLKVERKKKIHLQKLTELIQDCGVTFNIWNNKAGDLDWTSLSGSEKVKLLDQLPSKILAHDDVIFEKSKAEVVELWTEFRVLYKYLNETADSGPVIFERTKKMASMFFENRNVW